MMEREFVPPAPAVEPSRLPTSEERQMIREARLRAIPQPEPMAVPTPTPVLETSAPQQIALNINSFSYGDLLSAYTGMKRAIGREDFVPVMRQGRPVSKPTKKELYNYFDELGALDVIYENRD
jgi:hypothetical protein